MKRLFLYCFVLATLIFGCEDIYVPDIDDVSDAIVVDARIVKGHTDNYIRLTKSQGFNDDSNGYAAVSGGKIFLIDNQENVYELPEEKAGEFYVNIDLLEDREYKIQIKHGENIFESEFERVPLIPDIDTVYGIPETKFIEVAGETDADDIRTVDGVQLYADMTVTPENSNYRFTAHYVMEYTFSTAISIYYYWNRSPAGGIFNIAAAPAYSSSKNIVKHPLYFFRKFVWLEPDHYLTGWIMVLYQHAISESTYTYYKDLNAQLDSEGRIFDPVYVQARSNIKCTNNSKEFVLGNFEISNMVEHRYFIRFVSKKKGYEVREVFDRSPIPWNGNSYNVPPPFWVQ